LQEILPGIQLLLDELNLEPESLAQGDAFNLFKKDQTAYKKRVRNIVKESPA
ncbi:hypothetical protein CC86DRAFT_238916, partial [Ophiobolus disseminans]